jgi:hypothetical protein
MLKKLKNLILQENYETTIKDMIKSGEFDDKGKAVVDCKEEITNDGESVIKQTDEFDENKCYIYYITDETVEKYQKESNGNKDIYTVPCDPVTNLSAQYKYSNDNGICTVEKMVDDSLSSTNGNTEVPIKDINKLSFEEDGSAKVECSDIIMNDNKLVVPQKNAINTDSEQCYVYNITDDNLEIFKDIDTDNNPIYTVPCNAVINTTDTYEINDDEISNGQCTLKKIEAEIKIGGGNPIYTNDINFSDDGEAEVDCGSEIIISGSLEDEKLNTNIKLSEDAEKCVIYNITDDTVKNMETKEGDEYTYIIPCGSAIYNLTEKYKRVDNEGTNTCTVKKIEVGGEGAIEEKEIKNMSFNENGSARVGCDDIITNNGNIVKPETSMSGNCYVYNITDEIVVKYSNTGTPEKPTYKVPCNAVINTKEQYVLKNDDDSNGRCTLEKIVSGEGEAASAEAAKAEAAKAEAAKAEAAALPQTKYTITMQQNGEFKDPKGMANVPCDNIIIDSNTGKELKSLGWGDGICRIFNISDQTVTNWENAGTDSNPEYVVPCRGDTTYNLSSKYILDIDNSGNVPVCYVKKSVISLVDNDKFQFEIDENVKCSTKFTGFKKTNTDDDTTENVCIQNCRNGAPFFMTKDTNRPVCKYRPIYNRVDNKTNIMCPDGKFYKDANRLGIDIDEADMEGVCVATTISYVSTSGYNM